nr:MAG TPA: hypothetical protein [Caudoviricetes sp.]
MLACCEVVASSLRKGMTQKKRRQFVLTTLLPFKGGFIMIWKGATLYYP